MYFKVFILSIFFMPFVTAAGIIVTPTRLIYQENTKAQTVQIRNNSKLLFLASAVFEEKSQSYFAITPPIARLEAGETSILRVRNIDKKNLPLDRESVFNYSITLIANEEEKPNENNKVAVASRYWFKLFYRPDGIGSPKKNSCNLKLSNSGGVLYIENDSPFFSTLIFLGIDGKRISLSPEKAMIAPYSSQQIKSSKKINVVEWIRVNDYGGSEEKCINHLLSE